MKKRNPYILTVFVLYLNYAFQGIAAIILAQNRTYFLDQWQADLTNFSTVLAAIGLGRILSLNLAGVISDRIGRRQAMYIGVLSYVVFYLGLFYSPNYQIAFVVSIFAGFGNAFLDTSTYPIVMEAFRNGESNRALSVLNKAFISIGQFLFPFMVRYVVQQGLSLAWLFILPAAFLLLNLLLLMRLPFPEMEVGGSHKTISGKAGGHPRVKASVKAYFNREGSALLIFSFVSVSLFNIFITWIPLFGEQVLQMQEHDANTFVSLYSIFSLVSVFVTSYIIRRGMPVLRWIIICLTVTGLSLVAMLVLPSLYTVIFATFAVGFFAAGGIWQLGLVVMLEFFPERRGVTTSFYSLATSISVMVVPYLTGVLASYDVALVFWVNAGLALIGFISIAAVVPAYRQLNPERG